jgi:thiol-disulfide isomerase/thioredoxin
MQKKILLIATLVVIGAAIYLLESQKNTQPLNNVDVQEIYIEDSFIDDMSGTADEEERMTVADELDTEVPKQQTRAESIEEKAKRYERAKEITTPDGFINTDAITLSELIGKKVILIDFWTYSCINCQRTTPFLNSWYEKYADDGLEIIGIHTPEFEFEKDYENVRDAVERLGIEFPVVLDNDYSTWGAYRNRYWPRKYIIDIDGFVVYDHIGEGAYSETEAKIVELLNEKNDVLGLSAVAMDSTSPENVDIVDNTKPRTPESYLGHDRIEYIANLPSKDCFNNVCEYTTPESININSFAFNGSWRMNKEESTLISDEGSITSHFVGNKVNLVAGSDTPIEAEIYLDGVLISNDYAGSDVVDGVVTFEAHTLYNLVDQRGMYGVHTLEIRFKDAGISAFAFTFG